MKRILALIGMLVLLAAGGAQALKAPDETPPSPEEFGFRPEGKLPCQMDPPGFVWRPQADAASYEIEVSRTADFKQLSYRANGIRWNVHHPRKPIGPGQWNWRFRFTDKSGTVSAWSRARAFGIASNAVIMPHPDVKALVPAMHPRLMLRPEDLSALRAAAKGSLQRQWVELAQSADKMLTEPAPIEPPLYPKGKLDVNDHESLKMWGDNWTYTTKLCDRTATLAFCNMISGDKRYLDGATQLLRTTCAWDPHGSTGYLYNDEAGMPFAYLTSRAYDWSYANLSEQDRKMVRELLRERGNEIYQHLLRSEHTWKPYGSHRNRAWHFLGEVAIALYGEVPEAAEWLDYALDVFFCVYPVWSDEDGGWHEGVAYWRSYMDRVTWWLDAIRALLKIDPYQLPYFHQVGNFVLYQLPPGTKMGTYGDQAPLVGASSFRAIMGDYARGAGDPYWSWYAGDVPYKGYLAYLRAMRPMPAPKTPADLPTSRCFRGTGIAALNTNLVDGTKNIQWIFKSSPMGLQSHGYNAQNSFWMNLGGEPLFYSPGRRDGYGSIFHQNWMWETKSCNSILVDGVGQAKHLRDSKGQIASFQHSERYDYIAGEAASAYPGRLDVFRREMLWVRPGLMLILDRLAAKQPASYQWLLHSPVPFEISGMKAIARTTTGEAEVSWLEPQGLAITQSDKFDPPNSLYQETAYHLTASLEQKASQALFVTAIRPTFKNQPSLAPIQSERSADRIAAVVRTAEGPVRVWVSLTGKPIAVKDGKLSFTGRALVIREDAKGARKDAFVLDATKLSMGARSLISTKTPVSKEVGL